MKYFLIKFSLLGSDTISHTAMEKNKNTSLRTKDYQIIYELRIIAKYLGYIRYSLFICFDDV